MSSTEIDAPHSAYSMVRARSEYSSRSWKTAALIFVLTSGYCRSSRAAITRRSASAPAGVTPGFRRPMPLNQ